MERIDDLAYHAATTPEGQESNLFLTGPAEFLCAQIAKNLILDPVWLKIYGPNIDPYKRMDYQIRNLPALRIYNNGYSKDYESWFVNGDIVLDSIFPANIRRRELQQLPDTISAALLQQFRRPGFFVAINQAVPGLNELGKRVTVDKNLAFEWENDLVPLTQITLNFRVDLREWDLYLETDYRTLDDPFTRPLGDLKSIFTTIQALREEGEVEVTLESEQTIDDEE